MIADQIMGIIAAQFELPPDDIRPHTQLSSITTDSLQMIDLFFTIEHETGLRADESKMVELETVDDLVRLFRHAH